VALSRQRNDIERWRGWAALLADVVQPKPQHVPTPLSSLSGHSSLCSLRLSCVNGACGARALGVPLDVLIEGRCACAAGRVAQR
jgi:hypothetical protein